MTVGWDGLVAAGPGLADAGRERVDDAATRAAVFCGARHVAQESEIAFELRIDRAMHTRWENVLTPEMRAVHRKWRAARSARSWLSSSSAPRRLAPPPLTR